MVRLGTETKLVTHAVRVAALNTEITVARTLLSQAVRWRC
jgi:hypothetical protein